MDDIVWAYESIVRGDNLNWLLLSYNSNTGTVQDELKLFAYGNSGLPEMKAKMSENLEMIYVAFLSEEPPKRGHILVNYIPSGISGVRRARTMVHSRRMGQVLKSHETTLTVDHISNLTGSAIVKALADPDGTHVITTARTSSEPTDITNSPLPEPQAYPVELPVTPNPPSKSNNILSNLLKYNLKRSKTGRDESPQRPDPSGMTNDSPVVIPFTRDDDLPPPTPPKDTRSSSPSRPMPVPPPIRAHQPSASMDLLSRYNTMPSRPLPSPRDRSQSLSEFAVISHGPAGSGEPAVYSDDEFVSGSVPRSFSKTTSSRRAAQRLVPLPEKWSSIPVLPGDPETRAKMRAEAKADREREEFLALQEEAERQARIKAEKEEAERAFEEEEERRKATVERELRRATTQRRMKEEKEKEEEERKKAELARRRESEKKRREEEHRRLAEWRKNREKEVEQEKEREEHERRQGTVEQKKRVELVVAQIKHAVKKGDKDKVRDWMTGDVSMQKMGGDTLIWRRRHFRVVGQMMLLYKSAKDTQLILHNIDMRNDVKAIKEWHEGYEDLKAIPHSFALEFKDRREPWSMYADTQEDKDKILGLFNYLGGN